MPPRKGPGKPFSKTNQPKVRGRTAVPKDLREAMELTKARLRGMINKHLWMTQHQLKTAMQNANTPMIELLVGSIIHKALVEGDQKRLDFILDRMIGKVKEEVDIKTYIERLNGMNEAQIIDMSKQAITYLKASNE